MYSDAYNTERAVVLYTSSVVVCIAEELFEINWPLKKQQ